MGRNYIGISLRLESGSLDASEFPLEAFDAEIVRVGGAERVCVSQHGSSHPTRIERRRKIDEERSWKKVPNTVREASVDGGREEEGATDVMKEKRESRSNALAMKVSYMCHV